MRLRTVLSAVLLIGVLVPVTVATSADRVTPQRQWAIVNFEHPTKVFTEILQGPYLVVHDEAHMTRGSEPCTSFYPVGPSTDPHQAAVSFRCIPRTRPVVERFTMATEWDHALGLYNLTEYQFARDTEGHGVPIAALASDESHRPHEVACAR